MLFQIGSFLIKQEVVSITGLMLEELGPENYLAHAAPVRFPAQERAGVSLAASEAFQCWPFLGL